MSHVLKCTTPANFSLFYTGVEPGFLSEHEREAMEYSERRASVVVEQLNEKFLAIGLYFVAVEKSRDVLFELVDNCGDYIHSQGVCGGLNAAEKQALANKIAERYKYGQGQGFVRVRCPSTWSLLERIEITSVV